MISVVMLTKNEEAAIGTVIGEIMRVAPDAEIVIVDSSDDRTPEIASSLGAKVVRQHPPEGYNSAMALAFKNVSGDVVVTLDCDNTYPAEMIPEFARAITEEGYDIVDGSRLKGKPAAMPMINYIGNKFFSLIASLVFWRRFTDLHSGMRAYRRSMLERITYHPYGLALPVELLLRPVRMGFRLKTVFIDYRERVGRSTMRPIAGAWWTIRNILGCRFGTRR